MPVDTSMALEDALEVALIAFMGNTAVHGITLNIPISQELMDASTLKGRPLIVVKAEQLREMSPGTGVFELGVSVCLYTQADDSTNATQRQQWHYLRSILMWSALDTQLNVGATSFYVQPNSIIRDENGTRTESDRSWEQTFRFTCWAMSELNA